ncbi:MAG: Lrp/AsnC family transcriptional regulator [Candidatus Neomarinimicrobiota bacterium]
MNKLDSIDKKILTLLQEQGRMTNAELSKQVGLSAASALERVKKLERGGVIQGYYASLEHTAVGIGLLVLVEVTLARHQHDAILRFVEAVQDVNEIVACYHVTGRADYILRVVAKDIPDYERFIIETLSTLPGVQHIETMMVLSAVKESHTLPIMVG